MSFEGPFNLNHNLNITETPPHWLEKPQKPPKTLQAVSVREQGSTRSFKPCWLFSTLLFKARSRWEVCFSFRVKANALEGMVWKASICYLEYTTWSFISSRGQGNTCQPEPGGLISVPPRWGYTQTLSGSPRRTRLLPQQGRWLYKSTSL